MCFCMCLYVMCICIWVCTYMGLLCVCVCMCIFMCMCMRVPRHICSVHRLEDNFSSYHTYSETSNSICHAGQQSALPTEHLDVLSIDMLLIREGSKLKVTRPSETTSFLFISFLSYFVISIIVRLV